MDAFYASVAQRDSPELRGRPLIVSWSTEPRSVVVAASYEARKFGIHSAMPATRAVRLCPQAVFVKPDFHRYKEVSRQIREIFLRYTPLVEPLSLDEAYLDVTEDLADLKSATETARHIRQEILEETQLTASAGVAPNKFLAKIASDINKPDGLCVIKPHQVDAFLLPLNVGRIPGVGKATGKILSDHSIETIEQLRRHSAEQLSSWLGSFGGRLWELARGIDEHPVEPSRECKSYSSENTFSQDKTIEEIGDFLDGAARDLWESASRKSRVGRTVTVKLRTGRFETATRRLTLDKSPADATELAAVARLLLGRFTFPPLARFRLAGLGFSNFEIAPGQQEDLFIERPASPQQGSNSESGN